MYSGTSPVCLSWHRLFSSIVKMASFHWVSNYQWRGKSAVSCYTVSFNVRGL